MKDDNRVADTAEKTDGTGTAARAVRARVKEAADRISVSLKIAGLRSERDDALRKLGLIVYRNRQKPMDDYSEEDKEATEKLFETVSEKNREITRLKIEESMKKVVRDR